jgi:hypothetical protein
MLSEVIKILQNELNAGGASPKLLVDGVAGNRTIAELERQAKILTPAPVIVVPKGFAPICRSRSEAIKRFGPIDLTHAHWPDQSKWMKVCPIPDGWFPHWIIAGTSKVVSGINCNIDLHGPLLAALTEIHQKGLGDVLKTFDGCFNIRAVRGSTAMSTHAYGLALDINANINPLAGTHGDFSRHLDVVDCFKRQGFSWGGNWNGRKDQMHFSRCWE